MGGAVGDEVDTQARTAEAYREAFKLGFETARSLFGAPTCLEDIEVVKRLPAGSVVKDARGRVQFRTTANGWVSIASTHTSSMYVAMPVEVLYHG